MAPPRRRFSPSLNVLTAAWLAGAPVFLAGCADDEPDPSNVYCVNEDGEVIPREYCDDDGYYNGYPVWLWVTSSQHNVGYHVPASQRHGSSYFRANNPQARQNAGLTRTGRIPSTISHSGGFGHGGSDGSHSGGG